MYKTIVTTLLVALFAFTSVAQNFTMTTISHEGINLKKYDKDQAAHAVVLNEHGEVRFLAGGYGRVLITFEHHVRLKIFDEQGIKYGMVEIPLYNTDINGMEETIDEIRGVTIYKDENGVEKTEELNDHNIITIKKNRHNRVIKFELPQLRPGCVVDYTYRFVTPFLQNLQTWTFQDEIPKITSTFETFIPQFWTYSAMLRGTQKLSSNTANRIAQCYVVGTLKSDCVHTVYTMNDIPAFIMEDYMVSPKNFMSALYFEMTRFVDPYSSKNVQIASNWEEIDAQYANDQNFGAQLKKVDFLTPKIAPVVNGLTDQLDKAKAIYKYIQSNVKWDSTYAVTSSGIRRTFEKHTGDSGDINLLLTAALRAAEIPSSTVLLSTKDHGSINSQYPNPTAFNHIVVEVKIDDKLYLLDATNSFLPFGVLPQNCLNGKARVLSLNEPAHWVDPIVYQNQNITYLFNLALQDNGKLRGTLTSRYTNAAAYEKRTQIKEFKTKEAYKEALTSKFASLKISNAEINNLDSLDYPLTESFDIEINTDITNNSLTFNPYLINQIITNPFKTDDRKYPIDLGVPSDTKTIVNITYPEGYVIENPPQNMALSLPEQSGRFSITTQTNSNSLMLSCILSFKKAIYSIDEYQQLKELYDKIIERQKASITLSKKI